MDSLTLIFKMLRQFKLVLISMTLISFVLIAIVSVSFSSSLPDGFKPTPKDEFDQLQQCLEHADLASKLKERDAKVGKIESAYQNDAGEYAIRAKMVVNGITKNCCILAAPTPHYDFNVKCAQCDKCTCFDKMK